MMLKTIILFDIGNVLEKNIFNFNLKNLLFSRCGLVGSVLAY